MAAVAARATTPTSAAGQGAMLADVNADACPAGSRPAKLFIGGITRHTTTKQLRDHFARYGRVLDCVAMRQPDGRPRGFGYVTLDSPAAADRCLAEPQVIDGRVVDMKRAVPEGSAGSSPTGYEGHPHFPQDFYMGQHHAPMLGWPSMEGMLPPEMIYGAVTTPTGAAGHYWGHHAAPPGMEAPSFGRPKPAALETPDCVELLRGGSRAPGLGRPAFVPASAPPTPTGASTGGMLNAGAAEFVPMALPQKVTPEAGKRRSHLEPKIAASEESQPAPQAEVAKAELSENEPQPLQPQQTRRRAVLGEITNIANIANDQIKKGGDIMPKADSGIVSKTGIFAGSENASQQSINQSGQENMAPASARGLKLTSTRPVASEFDICLDEEAVEKEPAVPAEAAEADSAEGAEAEQTVPPTPALGPEGAEDVELPSIGSAEHSLGTCKRCNFYPKGRCQNGKNCTFCHFSHDKRKPSRQEKRERRAAWLAQRGEGETGELSEDDDEGEEGEEFGESQQTMAYSILPGLPPMCSTMLPAPLALPGSGAPGNFCMPPPGLAPQQQQRQRTAPPMLGLDAWQVEDDAGVMRLSPTGATTQRSMSVLSTVPYGPASTPHSLAPSPMGSHAFMGCSQPATPSGSGMALATSPVGAFSGKVMCTIATQTERVLCQKCGNKEKCQCASPANGEKVWSREEMLRVREALSMDGEKTTLRTVSSASLECQ